VETYSYRKFRGTSRVAEICVLPQFLLSSAEEGIPTWLGDTRRRIKRQFS
jgi:hypothetical protein